MSQILNGMLEKLSNEDKQVFEELLLKLKAVQGDISQLEPQDIQLIQMMESKYGEPSHKLSSQSVLKQKNISTNIQETLLDTPFAFQVRQIIARDLGAKFPLEEDAVAFVFENKWLPIDCQDESLVGALYDQFKLDIDEANQWREGLGDHKKDTKMALGLAWFMVIFQLNKRLQE